MKLKFIKNQNRRIKLKLKHKSQSNFDKNHFKFWNKFSQSPNLVLNRTNQGHNGHVERAIERVINIKYQNNQLNLNNHKTSTYTLNFNVGQNSRLCNTKTVDDEWIELLSIDEPSPRKPRQSRQNHWEGPRPALSFPQRGFHHQLDEGWTVVQEAPQWLGTNW